MGEKDMHINGTLSPESRKQLQRRESICVCFCQGAGGIYCTFSLHAYCQTLLEAAGRTTFPLWKVHGAALLFCTGVMLVILHWAFKEALQRETDCKPAASFFVHYWCHRNLTFSSIAVDCGYMACTTTQKHLMELHPFSRTVQTLSLTLQLSQVSSP